LIPYALWVLHDALGNAPELMPEDERVRVFDHGDWKRVGGGIRCTCDRLYYDHEPVLGALWLTRLCNGQFVKL
jgi:hypothetical protein